jgi:uncharacterized membrane protein YphA (DoxX/SURF4 family)
LAVLALRLAVGWHFFREGADKLVAGDFRSAGFMEAANGPFAPLFRSFIWDADGRARLDKDRTLRDWNQYREQVVQHYGFDEKQAKVAAQEIYDSRSGQLEEFFKENSEDIDTYLKGLDRRHRNREDPAYTRVTSLRGQASQIERELSGQVGPWLATIEAIRRGYERDLNALATEEQAKRGTLAMKKPGRKLLDTVFIDKVIPIFDLAVGVLLIFGLFTRLASLAGAGFLASIIATQWPCTPGSIPAHYQIIEMFALLVLAAVGAGRFFGLDFFVGLLYTRCCRKKTESDS